MNTYYLFAVLDTAVASSGPDWLKMVLISLGVGLVFGLIVCLSLKGQLKSVYKNDSAADYTVPGSFKVERRKDSFLYSKTEKEEKPQNNAGK